MGIFLFCPEDLPQSMRLVEDELLSKARERWGASYLGGRWGQHFGYQRWSWVFALLIISFLWVPTKKMDLCPCKYYCIMRLHLCNRWMYELPDAIKIWLELRSRSCFLFFSSQFRKWKRHNILPIRKGVSQHKDFMKSIQKLWEFLFFPLSRFDDVGWFVRALSWKSWEIPGFDDSDVWMDGDFCLKVVVWRRCKERSRSWTLKFQENRWHMNFRLDYINLLVQ